jgi:hypothetical protein
VLRRPTDAGDVKRYAKGVRWKIPPRVDEGAVCPFAGRLAESHGQPMKLVCAQDDVPAPKKEK